MSSEAEIRYSIVVPFFNEQENIPPLYMKLTEVMDSPSPGANAAT